jgi:phage terminase large subunit-like protein
MSESWIQKQQLQISQRCSEWAIKQTLGKLRPMRNQEERERVAEKMKLLEERGELFRYLPHPKQDLFHRAKCKRKVFLGGNQSGKTTALLAEAVSTALGWRPWDKTLMYDLNGEPLRPPTRVLLAGEDFTNSVQEVLIPKMKELIPYEALVTHQEREQGKVHKLHFWNGSTIKFLSYMLDPGKWEGYTWHWAGFDEPPPQHAYIATSRGCMRFAAPICFSQTPLKEPWVYDQLFMADEAVHCDEYPLDAALVASYESKVQRSSILVLTVDIDENPYLGKEEKEEFLKGLDEEEREARQHGRFRHLMGRVYKDFDPGVHVLDEYGWDPSWPSGLVVDPHDRRPYALGWFVVSPRDEIIWIEEWPSFDFVNCRSWDWGIDDYVEYFEATRDRLGLSNLHWRIMDPRFGATPKATTGTTLFEEFANRGWYFDHLFHAGEIEAGRMLVREHLKNHQMLWLHNCHNFRKAFLNHVWEDYKGRLDRAPKESEADKYKDFCDVARYCAEAGPHYFEQQTTQTSIHVKNLGFG